MRQVKVAATQMACSWAIDANLANAERMVRDAAARGAQIVLLQELFETPYFCIDQNPAHFALAKPYDGHPWLPRLAALARELGVVLPVSFFEQAGQTSFNSLVVFDADGRALGLYRKTHIPDGPGYSEKYFFTPGDTGFRVWDTAYGRIGVGICWDQWFPECARALALAGAELLLYPTAIGSEPHDPSLDSRVHWQNTQRGHAAANLVPLVASNRIGVERGEAGAITFYGSSFIAGPDGEKLAECDGGGQAIVTADFDLDALAYRRRCWGVFRDRRPDCYRALSSGEPTGDTWSTRIGA
ncbi:N-carbamoylputrescine amidase [Burkholderia ubonensis]|uniref:N-carbamoylputrescine amidase n=1 Tax=Burkholderia ubonensis TaxID=101571 RepID=UPI00075C74AC|nr:N-carbamoylputrescine amidase [Burkholderia ubonensis]KVR20570.1 N-carbamoylputrescine amidase [Burkholderia ubonensis]